MNYGNIKYCDIADGEGVRTSLFVSGCTHRCPGCFQPETWDFSFGEEFSDEVAEQLLSSLEPPYVDGLTLLGGEPMEPENQRALVGLVDEVRRRFPDKTIWIYTGDRLEDLLDEGSARHTEVTERILECADVLVDGPFREDLKDITLRFRGSSTQRLIDLKATREQGEVVEWRGDEAFSRRGSW